MAWGAGRGGGGDIWVSQCCIGLSRDWAKWKGDPARRYSTARLSAITLTELLDGVLLGEPKKEPPPLPPPLRPAIGRARTRTKTLDIRGGIIALVLAEIVVYPIGHHLNERLQPRTATIEREGRGSAEPGRGRRLSIWHTIHALDGDLYLRPHSSRCCWSNVNACTCDPWRVWGCVVFRVSPLSAALCLVPVSCAVCFPLSVFTQSVSSGISLAVESATTAHAHTQASLGGGRVCWGQQRLDCLILCPS